MNDDIETIRGDDEVKRLHNEVKRLHKAYGAEIAKLREDYRYVDERLHQELNRWQLHDIEKQREVERLRADIKTYEACEKADHADIERLRVEVEAAQTLAGTYEDENERLREEKTEHPPFENLFTTIRELEEEVERLQGELLEVHDKLAHADNEVERLRKEVEFLRQTLMQDTIPEDYLLARERAEAEVERLQEIVRVGFAAQERADYQAIEMLKAERRAALTELLAAKSNVKQLAAENEKLRQEVADHERADEEANIEFRRLRAENERLRNPQSILGEVMAENEKLRAHQERTKALKKQAEEENESLRFAAENAHQDIERLREDRARLKESATKWFNAHQKLTDIVAGLNKENEKLRESRRDP